MTLRAITEADWPEIENIQADAYREIKPETLAVLQSKWLCSPDTCFVYEQDGRVMGYLLAHPWLDNRLPKLDQTLPATINSTTLFLHDLVLVAGTAGKGIGRVMVAHLLELAQNAGFAKVTLIAVQNSNGFWQKQGFTPQSAEVSSEYGPDAQAMTLILACQPQLL